MTINEKMIGLKIRLQKLQGREQNIKSPGVVRKIKRQLRGLEAQL